MRAVGVTGFVVNGAEASAIDVVEVGDAAVTWTVALPNGQAGRTFSSADPGVVAFVRQIIGSRTLPDPVRPTSEAATPA